MCHGSSLYSRFKLFKFRFTDAIQTKFGRMFTDYTTVIPINPVNRTSLKKSGIVVYRYLFIYSWAP